MRASRVWALAFALVALCSGASIAAPTPSRKLVIVGLRPVNDTGDGQITQLAEAQNLRAAFHAALQSALGQRVLGHVELSKILDSKYLVTWFKCAGDLPCIGRLLATLESAGYDTAITGDYVATETSYRVRVVAFTIADHKVLKEFSVEIPLETAKDPATWQQTAMRIIANARLRLRSNVSGATCVIDGVPCVFESDSQTIMVTPGQHTLVLSKQNYDDAKAIVDVEPEGDQEVALALRPRVVAPQVPGAPRGEAADRPTVLGVRTAQKIEIDGKLDEPTWAKAWLETSLQQHFPDEKKPPTQRTEIRVLYDNSAIYVGVRCNDTEANKIVARMTRRDRDIDGDRVTVDISSKNDRASAFHFQVNAAGVQLDGIRFNDTEYSSDWDGLWYSATTRDGNGWTAEFEIPLVTLRYSGAANSFGFQVRRYLGRRGEIDEWAYIPSTAQGEVSYYGTLADLSKLNAKRLVEVLAYDQRSVIDRSGQGAFDGRELTDRFGADARLGITSALTLDATFNPDFGTVEADQVILNVTTVETYLPEKRRFFVEGSELFATPFQLLYSRRIGSAPPPPSVGVLAEPLPPGKIWGAVKLTGILTGRLSIALLDSISARRDAEIERPDGQRDRVLVDPLTNYSVLRLKQEFGTNSSIGLTATAATRSEPRDEAAPVAGDGCPIPYKTAFTAFTAPAPRDGRCSNDAYVAGLDMSLRTEDGMWGMKSQVVGSRIQNGPTQIIPDGTQLRSGDSGFGAKFEAGRYGGENWLFNVQTQHLSPRFQINDVGYLDLANLHQVVPSLTWRTTRPHGFLQSIEVEARVDHKRTFEGSNLSTDPRIAITTQLRNLWSFTAVLEPYYPRWYENRETQDGARTERNHGYFYQLVMSSDPSKNVVFSASAYLLQNIGALTEIVATATLSLKPTPPLELDLIASTFRDANGPRWFDTADNGDGSRTYLFADLDARSADLTLRGTYTFTRKLSLQAYLQTFVASGHWSDPIETVAQGSRPTLRLSAFDKASLTADDLRGADFREGAINLNLFMRYEYKPLSALWLVFTRGQEQRPYDPTEGSGRLRFDRFNNGPVTNLLLVKLTYLWH